MKKITLALLMTAVCAPLFSANLLAADKDPALFLKAEQLPDSASYLPPPPAYDSVAFTRDKAAYELGRSLKGTPRWEQAIRDANLNDEELGHDFSEALGVEISPQNTPYTYQVMRAMRYDSGEYGPLSAKRHYMRIRPFVHFNSYTCQSEAEEKGLRRSGSYPSGHTTMGWSMALVLAEIRPERANQILKRGYEYGESRVICGAHWQSDVDAGMMVGAAAVSRLHAEPAFLDLMSKAKAEIAAKVAKAS